MPNFVSFFNNVNDSILKIFNPPQPKGPNPPIPMVSAFRAIEGGLKFIIKSPEFVHPFLKRLPTMVTQHLPALNVARLEPIQAVVSQGVHILGFFEVFPAIKDVLNPQLWTKTTPISTKTNKLFVFGQKATESFFLKPLQWHWLELAFVSVRFGSKRVTQTLDGIKNGFLSLALPGAIYDNTRDIAKIRGEIVQQIMRCKSLALVSRLNNIQEYYNKMNSREIPFAFLLDISQKQKNSTEDTIIKEADIEAEIQKCERRFYKRAIIAKNLLKFLKNENNLSILLKNSGIKTRLLTLCEKSKHKDLHTAKLSLIEEKVLAMSEQQLALALENIFSYKKNRHLALRDNFVTDLIQLHAKRAFNISKLALAVLCVIKTTLDVCGSKVPFWLSWSVWIAGLGPTITGGYRILFEAYYSQKKELPQLEIL